MAATLAILISGAAQAQQMPGMGYAPQQAPGMGYAPPGIGGATMPQTAIPGQARQVYVPQHFKADGQFVPPHYEAPKTAPFRGYFANTEANRQRQKQHGYKEPAPDYTTPQPDTTKQMEGR